MGYFNYFIKCIIRNLAYRMCKPKVFCTVLLSVAILFGLKHFGFCSDWTDGDIEEIHSSITNNQGVIISQLSALGIDVSDLEKQLQEINTDLDRLKNIETYSEWTVSNLEALNTKIGSLAIQIDAIAKSNSNIETYANWQLQVLESINNKLDTITNSILQKQDALKAEVELGNQLQEQNNQIQQEQNDLIKDDNVNSDGFQFATDDTENPTTDGFNTLFTSVYNAFCNTSSAPLTITLPFVDQTFSISPNLVSDAMQKSGLGVIATLIHSFYYYSVCLFIYKDINKIIEHLKSGNLTADCGNVKTEVL